MKASELHAHLSGYLAQAPQNGEAEVVLRIPGTDTVFGLIGANDARGMMPGQHLLILLPDESKAPLGVREMRFQ